MQGKRLFLSKNLHFHLKYSILTALDGTDDAEVLDGGAIGNGVERCHAVAGAAGDFELHQAPDVQQHLVAITTNFLLKADTLTQPR